MDDRSADKWAKRWWRPWTLLVIATHVIAVVISPQAVIGWWIGFVTYYLATAMETLPDGTWYFNFKRGKDDTND